MKFIIEKNKPLFHNRTGLHADMSETMQSLGPDDSFLVLSNKVRPETSVKCTFYNVKKQFKIKFPNRRFTSAKETLPNAGGSGLRIWRLPDAKPETIPAKPEQG